MSSLLIKNGTIVTFGQESKVLKDHVLLISGDKIDKIAKSSDLPPLRPKTKVIDAKGKLVLPGFINTHTHFYSAFARGLSNIKSSANFIDVLNHLWWRLDKKLSAEDVYYSGLVSAIDAIKKGTTTIFDHHASPGALRGSLNEIARAVKETGIRATLCYELSDRDGEKVRQQGIDENAAFLESCQTLKNPLLKALFGLHASFTLSDQSLREAQKVAATFDAGIHIHACEDKSDQKITHEKYGLSVIQRLEKWGLLGSKTLCAHGVHLNEQELDLIKKHNAIIIHNPQSNMNNGVGALDLNRLTKRGLLVGLGTDAMTNNMLEELRTALWLQRHHSGNPSAGFDDVCNALFCNNALIAQRFFQDQVGVLAEGAAADVILMDYLTPTDMTDNNIYGHAVFGFSQAVVDTTIISGQIVMEDKKMTKLDEQAIYASALQCSQALWKRL